MKKIDIIKNTWSAIYDPEKDVDSEIEKYFHPEYEQCINGVIMSRTEYIDHVIAQKKNMNLSGIDYFHHLENEEKLFAIYYPKGKNLEGADIEAEVISYFLFQDEKIIKIHGQVRLIKGKFSDVDMKDE
jgi:hypothetical protein